MDTSEIFVKMCREAKEIQEAWEPDPGDWYQKVFSLKHNNISVHIVGGDDWFDPKEGDGWVWLPTQSQLQKMLIGQDINQMVVGLNSFHEKNCAQMELKRWSLFNSMEQLWLAFVMENKFGKRWTGETWEAI